MRNVLGLAAVALTFLMSSGSQAIAFPRDPSLIAGVRSGWQDAMNDRDLFGMLSWYAPGAVVFPEAATLRLGAEAIADWHGRWLFGADVYYVFETLSLHIDGRWALEEWEVDITVTPRGDGETAIGGDPLQFQQRGFRVYRKNRAGRWRIDREVWAGDTPEIPELQRFYAGYLNS